MSFTFGYSASNAQNHVIHGLTDAESIESLKQRLQAQGYHKVWDIEFRPLFQGEETAYMLWMLETIGCQSNKEILSPYFVKVAQMLNYISQGETPKLLRRGRKFIRMCHGIHLMHSNQIPTRGKWMMDTPTQP